MKFFITRLEQRFASTLSRPTHTLKIVRRFILLERLQFKMFFDLDLDYLEHGTRLRLPTFHVSI